jgi:hypothetical protein
MLTFGHALHRQDAHFFKRVVSQSSAVSFHEGIRQVSRSQVQNFVG